MKLIPSYASLARTKAETGTFLSLLALAPAESRMKGSPI